MIQSPSLSLMRKAIFHQSQNVGVKDSIIYRRFSRFPSRGKPPSVLSPATTTIPVPIISSAIKSRSNRLVTILLQKPANAYASVHHKRPYITQLVTSFSIYLLGDLNAQVLVGRDDYDLERTARMVVVGLCLSIPSYHWFKFLGEQFMYRPKGVRIALIVFTNQIVFTPWFLTSFFGLQSVFAGSNAAETQEKLRKVLPIAFLNSCMFWPSVTSLSFIFVSPVFRPLFAGVIAVAWNGYLSFINQRAAVQLQQCH